MRWFLDLMYRGAERTYGLRAEVDEPELTPQERLARLPRPVIVLSRPSPTAFGRVQPFAACQQPAQGMSRPSGA